MPVDSDTPFSQNFEELGDFLHGLPVISDSERDLLNLPVNVPDLERAVAAASGGRSPGHDGLSYEFYRVVFGLVGPAMVDGLNSMLEQGHLSPSLCQGTVRLIPNVKGVSAASQLRPITLLNTDYEILIKHSQTQPGAAIYPPTGSAVLRQGEEDHAWSSGPLVRCGVCQPEKEKGLFPEIGFLPCL